MRRAKGTVSRAGWRALAATVVLLVLAMLVLPTALRAQTVENYGPWRGEYFNNQDLSGAPTLVRTDNFVDFDWGQGSPAPGIPVDHFSVRWTAFINFQAGTYRFTTVTDDGVRLFIDGALVLDQWRVQPATRNDIFSTLSAGYHYIRMEYFDNTEQAVAKMFWELQTPPQPTTGWLGEYYANRFLSGAPALTRTDPAIDFYWGSGSPAPGIIPDDNFSVRWTRTVYFSPGYYTFVLRQDDGARVWLDGSIIFDRWFDQSATTTTNVIYVSQGNHDLRVEYYEHLGVAEIKFYWQPGSAPSATPVPPPPPCSAEVIIDNLSPGFHKGGLASSWYSGNVGYRGQTYWTYNSVYDVFNYATWMPVLPAAGYYDVYAFIPRNFADTRSARYRVFHNGRRDDVVIGQYKYFDQWVKLGKFYFHGGDTDDEYVYLSDNTHEAYASRRLGFDAVKFVLVDCVVVPPVIPTPVPPPVPSCSVYPVAGFGQIWTNNVTVRNRLGCALAPEQSIPGAEEAFQFGTMLYFQDTQYIYVLYQNGTWQVFVDTWREGDPINDPNIIPPPGYVQPIRGFGKIWRTEPGVRDRLGWATEPEKGLSLAREQFERGLMIWSNDKGTFVLYQDGTWQHF